MCSQGNSLIPSDDDFDRYFDDRRDDDDAADDARLDDQITKLREEQNDATNLPTDTRPGGLHS